MDYEITCTHTGQYHAYGDSFTVYHIKTAETDREKVLEYLKSQGHCRGDEYETWAKNRWSDDPKYGMDYYFSGYWRLTQKDDGWELEYCHPYTD